MKRGGVWNRRGMGGFYYCVMPSKDHMKKCMNDSDCQYSCINMAISSLVNDSTVPIDPICSKFDNFRGECVSFIKDGKIKSIRCLD